MSSVVLLQASDAIPELEPKPWRARLLEALQGPHRLVTLYGRRLEQERPQVLLTAVLQAEDGALSVLRTRVAPDIGYHELTSELPALHCFEREVHEQTGTRIAAHGWLKPIRYQGRTQAAMNDYPFYRVDGKEVHEVTVGPIHAGVIEPGTFRFTCLGEQVHHLEIHLGYQHRGVEQRLLEREPKSLGPLVETIAGDSSVAHAWAYAAAMESLAGAEVHPQVDAARAVALELERVGMHLAGLAGLAADIGFLQGATTYGRLRTTAINSSMKLCGSRFGRGAVRLGGVGMSLGPALLGELRANLELMQRDLAIINDCFLSARTVQHRLRGVGVVSSEQARALGLVGMAARASGVALDQRALAAQGIYRQEPLALVSHSEGDCWSRGRMRIGEMDASLAWIAKVLQRYPSWEQPRLAPGPLAPGHLAIALVEGWRGEVVHALETGAAGELLHYKVQDPSLRNWMGLAIAVRNNEISDFPICNKSFDLSYCGNDL